MPSDGYVSEHVLTAYHEAGHVALAVETGWRIGEVSLRPTGGFNAHVRILTESVPKNKGLHPCMGYALTALAGPAVSLRRAGHLRRHKEEPPQTGETLGDRRAAWNALMLMEKDDWQLTEKRYLEAWRMTTDLIRSPALWAGVQALARTLNTLREMHGPSAEHVYRQARDEYRKAHPW